MATPPRPFQIVRTTDQWIRSVHHDTSLDVANGVVSLAWTLPPLVDDPGTAPTAAGLAFDQECRLYHSNPDKGTIEKLLWAAQLVGQVPEPLFPVAVPDPIAGEFAPPVLPPVLSQPTGLAVDGSDRLFVCETGAKRVLVYDLWSRRLLRRLVLTSRPIDVAAEPDGSGVLLLVDGPPGLFHLEARRTPVAVANVPPAALIDPIRIAIAPDGGRWVLTRPGGGTLGTIVPLADPSKAFSVDRATDIEFDGDGALVVARHPGEDFRRFLFSSGTQAEAQSLTARGYDGAGIVRTPDGRIGYWTGTSFRHAIAARVKYLPSGEVITYRLDSGAFQTVWGRLFLDACVPSGTQLRVHCVATDEPPNTPTEAPQLPSNVITTTINRPDLTPPLLPLSLYVAPADALHRRETGRELPWARFDADDKFETYEAPILSAPGRYLWVTIGLSGDTSRTPRVRSLRAEHPGHDYLTRIPKTFSRDPVAADFLQRYLAIFDGALGELDAKSAARLNLIEPAAAPPEVLQWLASFVGLLLDERWPVEKRRTLIEEAVFLFRYRGTIVGLRRYIEIYLDAPVHLLEHWRLRGLGAALGTGDATAPESQAILGGGFRIGGAIGSDAISPITGTLDDAFRTHAHRFSVLVAAALTAEQRSVIEFILQVHRPAHTIFDLCGIDSGMRVGRGLLVELSSVVGRTGGFVSASLGDWTLGRDTIIGRPEPGVVPAATRLGKDSRVG